jgi:hypothetical protein
MSAKLLNIFSKLFFIISTYNLCVILYILCVFIVDIGQVFYNRIPKLLLFIHNSTESILEQTSEKLLLHYRIVYYSACLFYVILAIKLLTRVILFVFDHFIPILKSIKTNVSTIVYHIKND